MTTYIDGVVQEDLYEPKTVFTGSVAMTGGNVADIFTIAGGPVLVEALFAEVTAAISDDASNCKLTMDPTNGADTDLCTVLDVADTAQYSFLTVDGTIGSAMVNAVPGTAVPLGVGMDIPMILPIGTIDLGLSTSAPSTGTTVWYMRYRPLKAGASVTA